MSINRISNMMCALPGYDGGKNKRRTGETSETGEIDIDKEENSKLAQKMYMAGTKSDAAAAYFGALQESVKDSKNGFEAHRRVTRLTSTHKDIVSSKEYEAKAEAKSVVKDLADSIDEKTKEIDERIKKRKKKDKSKDTHKADREKSTGGVDEPNNVEKKASEENLPNNRKRIKKDRGSEEETVLSKRYAINTPESGANSDSMPENGHNVTASIDQKI